MAIANGPKKPWIAASLALGLGGPGCFYLGWRRGVKALIGWMLGVLPLLLAQVFQSPQGDEGSLEPAILFFVLLQAALAWMAYSSCRRMNSEAAKKAESAESDPIRAAQVECAKEIRKVGLEVIVLSGITLFGSLMLFVNTTPPMGEMGPFMHDSAFAMVPMSLWGLATGIGLKRAWQWAWISMLVFGGLLAASCSLLSLSYLFISGGEMGLWNILVVRALGVLLFLVPAATGVWWFRFFLRDNVKSYFGISRKAPATSA